MNQKIYWVGIASISMTALGFGIVYPLAYAANPINQPLVEQQESRASGFTMRGEALYQKDAKANRTIVAARMFATGPMHDDEVIRMEGTFSLITPNGQVKSFGPSTWTFSPNLYSVMPVQNAPSGSKVKIDGTIYVYHRELIKSEREILPDGSIKLYMNIGSVTFSKIPNSNPAQISVDCENLGSVHQHGLELMSANNKTVSSRILLYAGKQVVERENLPFVGRKIGMEPYVIRQLIPKRSEPVHLVLPVRDLGR
ncbi:MAG: hypothetical protein JST12_00620 [Armatimonadetes bacterium]|nr:hypothetical protein [Armatimonadota bacterium]MBS1700138.1 hypothetical protein [Armatimonadota bacterium]MBS1726721.1 hypothetical protein [Armatimonadota bacterium]